MPQVFPAKGMSAVTMRLSCVLRREGFASTQVLLERYGFKMIWVYASAIPTEVVKSESWWNVPHKVLVDIPMRLELLAPPLDPAVTPRPR